MQHAMCKADGKLEQAMDNNYVIHKMWDVHTLETATLLTSKQHQPGGLATSRWVSSD
jgi:hypothetical protein